MSRVDESSRTRLANHRMRITPRSQRQRRINCLQNGRKSRQSLGIVFEQQQHSWLPGGHVKRAITR